MCGFSSYVFTAVSWVCFFLRGVISWTLGEGISMTPMVRESTTWAKKFNFSQDSFSLSSYVSVLLCIEVLCFSSEEPYSYLTTKYTKSYMKGYLLI